MEGGAPMVSLVKAGLREERDSCKERFKKQLFEISTENKKMRGTVSPG